jgi:hypothetical protein
VDLQGAGPLVDALTRAVEALPDFIEHSFSTTDKVVRKQQAIAARDKLKTLSRQLTGLTVHQNTAMLGALDDYIAKPTRKGWQQFEDDLASTLKIVGSLEHDLDNESSDFVLTGAYADMMKSLGSRAALAAKFVDIPPPTSAADIQSLKVFAAKYRNLIRQLNEAISKLNAFILTLP